MNLITNAVQNYVNKYKTYIGNVNSCEYTEINNKCNSCKYIQTSDKSQLCAGEKKN